MNAMDTQEEQTFEDKLIRIFRFLTVASAIVFIGVTQYMLHT